MMKRTLLSISFLFLLGVYNWAQPSSCASSTTNDNALNGNVLKSFGQSVTMTSCTFNNFFHSFAWTNRNTSSDYTTGTLSIYNGESTSGAIYTQSLTGLNADANATNTITLTGGTGTLQYTVPNQYTFHIHNLNGTIGFSLQRSNAASAYSGGRYLLTTTFDVSNRDLVFDVQTTNANPLPVELTYFNSTHRDNGEVLLTWQTATELNNEGFEIQRALGNAALEAGRWQVLVFMAGNGTTNEIQNYSYTDEHPQAGLNYYRLKQIDFDGKFEYSDVVSVEVRGNGEGGIQIFPNPAPSDKLTLYLPESNDGKATIRLYDQTGRLALQQTTSSQQQTLNVSQLPAGIYFVEVTVGRKVFREKVVVE